MTMLLAAFELERLLFRVAMAWLAFHCLRNTWISLRRAPPPPSPLPDDRDQWPLVTVQLPMLNEYYVAERVVRAAAALDYPRHRLEIQILDNSDDETRAKVDALAVELAAEGVPCRLVRRRGNEGFKAGTLAHGLQTARGEFIAMFDADCVPHPSFLRDILPHLLADPKVGMAQGSWSFLNRGQSLLTRAGGAILDALMRVEQPARSVTGQPFQFNGTSGVWRRACIDAAGGWRWVSVAEDLELSFRALLEGWRFVHVPTVAVPTELPETLRAMRVQQKRWVAGAAQALRTLAPAIARRRPDPAQRLGMLSHLGRRSLHLLLAFWTLTLPLTTFSVVRTAFDYPEEANAVFFLGIIASVSVFLVAGQLRAGVPFLSSLVAIPLVIGLYLSLSGALALAFVRGLLRHDAQFERTPKSGAAADRRGPRYGSRTDPMAAFEALVGLAYAGFALRAWEHGLHLYATFFSYLALCFLVVGVGTLLPDSAPRDAVAELA